MTRCVPVALLASALLLPALASAQAPRPFPATALRGELVITQPPEVLLNGKPARLSPGSRIRGDDNMLKLSGGLVGAKLVVNYTVEPLGNVHDVWILRPDEAARQPWPRTADEARRWRFDPASQTWAKP